MNIINVSIHIKDMNISTGVMLVTKIISNTFLTSNYACPAALCPSSLKQDICYLKIGKDVLKFNLFCINWWRMMHLFINFPHLYIHQLTTKYPWQKHLDPRNAEDKKFRTHKDMVVWWNKTHQIHNGARFTKFNTYLL